MRAVLCVLRPVVILVVLVNVTLLSITTCVRASDNDVGCLDQMHCDAASRRSRSNSNAHHTHAGSIGEQWFANSNEFTRSRRQSASCVLAHGRGALNHQPV